MVVHLRLRLEHLRHRRRLPELPASMDIDTMPVVRLLVATLSLVYGTVEHSARALRAARRGRGRATFSSPLPPHLARRRARAGAWQVVK